VLVCIIDLVYPPNHKMPVKDRKDENSDSGQESVSYNLKIVMLISIWLLKKVIKYNIISGR